MKTVSRQEILQLKFADRNSIPELEYHADGACVHLGKISPACRICFTGESGGGIQIGQECMCNCPECYYLRGREDGRNEHPDYHKDVLSDFFRTSLNDNWNPLTYAYQSAGETLLYIDKLLPFGPIFRQYERRRNIKIYHYIYTNGILIDEEMLDKFDYLKIKEIRFHCSASNFSDKVFKNMELSKSRGFTVSVEEPSMPSRRLKLLESLPVFHQIGVEHLNMVEVQLTPNNMEDLTKVYGDSARIYKDFYYHLYDEGLTYEVMREKIKHNYCFSVLDCNGLVECHRHSKNACLGMNMQTLNGMCKEF